MVISMNHSDSIYTHSERTVRKYSVGQAIASAERRLKGNKHFKGGMCINAVVGRPLSERITLQELNQIASQIVDDSFHYVIGT